MAKTSVILCAGAWHTQVHIDPVIPFFEKAGYRIVSHTLLVTGAQSNVFEDEVKATQSVIEAELQAGYDVVPIFHSLAGPSGLEAINNLTADLKDYGGKIKRIIFLASFLDIDPITKVLVDNEFVTIDMEKGLMWTQHGEKSFYNDMSPEAAQPFIEALSSIGMYSSKPEPSSNEWQRQPVTFLLCNQDKVVPPEIAEKTASEYGMQIARMDAGHCPFTSQPEKFVKVVDEILKA